MKVLKLNINLTENSKAKPLILGPCFNFCYPLDKLV